MCMYLYMYNYIVKPNIDRNGIRNIFRAESTFPPFFKHESGDKLIKQDKRNQLCGKKATNSLRILPFPAFLRLQAKPLRLAESQTVPSKTEWAMGLEELQPAWAMNDGKGLSLKR